MDKLSSGVFFSFEEHLLDVISRPNWAHKQEFDAPEPHHRQLSRQGFVSYFAGCIKQELERLGSLGSFHLQFQPCSKRSSKPNDIGEGKKTLPGFEAMGKVKDAQPMAPNINK